MLFFYYFMRYERSTSICLSYNYNYMRDDRPDEFFYSTEEDSDADEDIHDYNGRIESIINARRRFWRKYNLECIKNGIFEKYYK